jgi:hypothetical protein
MAELGRDDAVIGNGTRKQPDIVCETIHADNFGFRDNGVIVRKVPAD